MLVHCLLNLMMVLLLLLLLLQLPEGVKDLDGAALVQHVGKVQSAVMMAVNEHNTVAHAVSALMWRWLNVQQPNNSANSLAN
jgi:hypothetical protein